MSKLEILRKYSIVFCLAGAVVCAPVCSVNAKTYHHRDGLVAAAVGGAVVGLVGAVAHHILHPNPAVVVAEPVYVEPAPVVVHKTVVVRGPVHHRPIVRPVRHHHRHR